VSVEWTGCPDLVIAGCPQGIPNKIP